MGVVRIAGGRPGFVGIWYKGGEVRRMTGLGEAWRMGKCLVGLGLLTEEGGGEEGRKVGRKEEKRGGYDRGGEGVQGMEFFISGE